MIQGCLGSVLVVSCSPLSVWPGCASSRTRPVVFPPCHQKGAVDRPILSPASRDGRLRAGCSRLLPVKPLASIFGWVARLNRPWRFLCGCGRRNCHQNERTLLDKRLVFPVLSTTLSSMANLLDCNAAPHRFQYFAGMARDRQ